LSWLALLLFLPLQLRPAAPAASPSCDDLDLGALEAALVREITLLQAKSGPPLKIGERSVSPLEYSNKTLRPLWTAVKAGDRAALCATLKSGFTWHREQGNTLITAYHTPTVKGSRTQDATYRWPLYKRPADATRHSTAQILAGSLAGKGLELVWLADAYDALALHVEGAAQIELSDGTTLAVGTNGHNGMAYQNVSKLLAAAGKMPGGPPPQSSQPGNPKARKYFTEHPEDLAVYWGRNPHFVFFKEVQKAGGGRFGELTPGRSAAVDPERVPMGAVLFVRANKPVVQNGTVTGWTPFERVMLAQDTGAGIKGARMDLYFGTDEESLLAAQTMSVQGEVFVLLGK
jgi:membrane-bound lytic murein transglycosylase A